MMTSSKDAKPYVNVFHDTHFWVQAGTPEAEDWLFENFRDKAPDFFDSVHFDYFEYEPLLKKLAEAGITVYHWNARGLPLDEDVAEDEEAEDEDEDENASGDEGPAPR